MSKATVFTPDLLARAYRLRTVHRYKTEAVARMLGVKWKSLSAALSRAQLSRALRRRRRSPGRFAEEVRDLHEAGKNDREIAILLQTRHQRVFEARKSLGLPPNCTPRESGSKGRRLQGKKNRLRCDACNKVGDYVGRMQKPKGWYQKRLPGSYGNTYETYCPTCIREYGPPPKEFGFAPATEL